MRHPVRILAVLVLAAACGGKVSGGAGQGDAGSSSTSSSSSGGAGGSSSGGDNSCLETSGSPQACISCIESQCGPQLSAVESGCSDLLNCECPGGVYSESAAESCTTQGEEASCAGPATQISQCETQYCLSQCETISSSGGGSSSSGSSGGPTPLGCTVDTSLGCSGGAIGYACAIGDNPELADPDLSCSTPGLDEDGEVDFCCFSGGAWSGATCQADDDLTTSCPGPDTYAYQCAAGDDPTSYDPHLSCSTPTPDADGVHDDFCCTYD